MAENPNDEMKPYVLGNLAHSYLFTGNYDKAITIYNENANLMVGKNHWLLVVIDDFNTFQQKGIKHPDFEKAIMEVTESISFNFDNNKWGYTYDKRDKNYYQTVKIGNQIWFAQNLRYKHNNSITVGEKHENAIGRHYTYSSAIESCPDGWHLPSDEEWKIMEEEIGMTKKDLEIIGFQPRGENEKIGQLLLESGDIMFYAKYSGVGSQRNKQITALNKNGQYWTSTKNDEVNTIIRVFSDQFKSIVRDKTGIGNYLTIRCVKDNSINSLIENNSILKTITEKINANSDNENNYYNRSIEFLNIGENKSALDDINMAIKIDNSNLDFSLFKAEILYNYSYLNHETEIKRLVSKYIATKKNNGFAWFFDARLSVFEPNESGLNFTKNDTKLTLALSSINKALAIEPNNPEFLKLKSKIYFAKNDLKNAVSSMEKELAIDKINPDLNAILAITKLRYYDAINRKSNVNTGEWCTFTGQCYKLTQKQVTNVCVNLKTARKYGTKVEITPYEKICGDLRATELYQISTKSL